MATALNTFYTRRGFILLNNKVSRFLNMPVSSAKARQQGQPIQDAFRRGLGYVIQWYDILHVQIERRVESALRSADTRIQESKTQLSAESPTSQQVLGPTCDPHTASLEPATSPSSPKSPTTLQVRPLFSGQCARVLQQRCPACFAGLLYGRSSEM
jgi:hypothetical protein